MDGMSIPVLYRNYRGEVGMRKVAPVGLPRYISTEHHKEQQWILPVLDTERDVERDFALKDCDFTLGELGGLSIKTLTWAAVHGEGFVSYHAKTSIGSYAYVVDVNGDAWFMDGDKLSEAPDEAHAKDFAERCHRCDVLAELEKHVDLSEHLRGLLGKR